MCIIVDANRAHHLKNKTEDGKPILRWLLNSKKGQKLITGGQLTEELKRAGLSEMLKELDRAGRVHKISDADLSKTIEDHSLQTKIQSNDPHVIALAIRGQCNVIFTGDNTLLQRDLKNKTIVQHKISIYKSKDHTHLLTHCDCPK